MEQPVAKGRTPSRCREWERNRRNKFNEAISRLGEIMKEISRAKSPDKEADNVQYPKVEIVEKAIVCLKNFLQETTSLKSEILALQVKIESFAKQDKKDASTQVFIGINKKKSNGKYVKVVMLRKSKRKALKEKSVLTPNATVISNSNSSAANNASKNTQPKVLPTLLPKTVLTDKSKKGQENTIVVLPAAPYLFSQRPLLFPSAPPTYVLLDPNIQTLNKPNFPIDYRNSGDITKTTMVNILPITAYSRPLSALKTKKNNSKSKMKSDAVKKPNKTSSTKVIKENSTCESNKSDKLDQKIAEQSTKELTKESLETNPTEENPQTSQTSAITTKIPEQEVTPTVSKEINKSITEIVCGTRTGDQKSKSTCKDVEHVISTPKPNINEAAQKPIDSSEHREAKKKCEKLSTEKVTVSKDKGEKLPNILDTGLCENTVDGGNARLELAEEFLAASPTAAFLMSFPLVSGNRADSPAEEQLNTSQDSSKDTNQKQDEDIPQTVSQIYFEKSTPLKEKLPDKLHVSSNSLNKQATQKYGNITTSKPIESKTSNTMVTTLSNEMPFLSLPMPPALLPTSCSLSDSTFGLDFDCNLSKSMPSQSASYVSNSNLFYKSDPFSNVKSTIYSTSSISSGHEFNSFGLYPCAMEKYSSKNKSDYSNMEDNLMKIGSSRLTYDIDLGWSHKGFDFVNCTSAPNTFGKDNVLTTAPYSSSYNPFNPDFHVPLVANSTKKENFSKPVTSFAETMTSLYSQPVNLWSEDVPFYTNTSISKSLPNKHNTLNHSQLNIKSNVSKPYETKQSVEPSVDNAVSKASSQVITGHPASDKYAKKSQNKMHINWMTSETRTVQNNFVPPLAEVKEINKPAAYSSIGQYNKKHESSESNYFPISMLNFPSQPTQEDIQTWPSSRAAGTTEISIEPPPINLPTLVGDLALGPHDKRRTIDAINRTSHSDSQNCGNFLSVTQLMNRSTDNLMPRYQAPNIDSTKSIPPKQHISHTTLDNRKIMTRPESLLTQPCYGFGDSKTVNYEMMSQYPQAKTKTNKSDKTLKSQKNSYSAESLIRGGSCSQKHQDNNSAKFMMPSQKYNNFNPPQDTSVAQVSHFPAILDYPENNYPGQQFSGTNLYNSTTNTISNSFYSNFMPGSSNLMSGNYGTAPFSGEFIDYNQTSECNYTNHKYDDLKMRGNPPMFQQEKVSTNYKSSRREPAAKHKLECSKKETSKKCQNKRVKVNTEIEDWNDGQLLWQNKTPTKRHPNMGVEEMPFPNYVGNQVSQYQPELFNSHIMCSNVQAASAGHNVDRSLATFPPTSRANFNLSTIFPEITMKVQ